MEYYGKSIVSKSKSAMAMRPIALFDKSFLQSLSLDESVWFDQHFHTNVCPMFYVETLADLYKPMRAERTPEQEVEIIASKFPEMNSYPNVHHNTLSLASLMGYRIPMDGQIPLSGGRPVKTNDRAGVVFDLPPEAQAFLRWQKGKFHEVEKLFAHEWREDLKCINLNLFAEGLRAMGIEGKKCNTLEEAKAIALAVATGRDKPLFQMKRAIRFLGIPSERQRDILERWSIVAVLRLWITRHTRHVLTVDIFFQLSLAANQISAERRSNRIDIAYLYYLPFCMFFVSSDRLHQRCVPLFLREDQELVWGEDLKLIFIGLMTTILPCLMAQRSKA